MKDVTISNRFQRFVMLEFSPEAINRGIENV